MVAEWQAPAVFSRPASPMSFPPALRAPGSRYVLAASFVVLGLGWTLWPWSHARPAVLDERGRVEDFDSVWNFVREQHCWLPQEPVDWDAARAYYCTRAIAATGDRQFGAVLEDLLDELHDDHTHLDQSWADSCYAPPEDICAEWQGNS